MKAGGVTRLSSAPVTMASRSNGQRLVKIGWRCCAVFFTDLS
jgi:hypothetical protein